ncbi:MAG: hypothetical protein Kow00108_04200 [Calditrichia bacterium]
MKILVCDEQKDRAQLIRSLIESYNYKVKIENDEEEIEALLRENNLVLIIIGPRVKSKKGLELLQKVKSMPKYWDLPVVYISDTEISNLEEQLNQFKNVDVVTEPFKIKNFKHIIEKWLNFRSIYV